MTNSEYYLELLDKARNSPSGYAEIYVFNDYYLSCEFNGSIPTIEGWRGHHGKSVELAGSQLIEFLENAHAEACQ